MEPQVLKVLEAHYVTHNVKRFMLHKPAGFSFTPGQAAYFALNTEGWQQQFRPFTFTGLNRWEHLELLVKIYNDHDGLTHQLGKTNAGAELLMGEVFGAMQYKGPGVFIAGGSGITPFLSIFRDLYQKKQLFDCRLIYSNYTAEDVIGSAELHDMLKDNYLNHYTRQGVIGFLEKRLNEDLLVQYIANFGQRFYVCGSNSFVKDISAMLLNLGATADSLVLDV